MKTIVGRFIGGPCDKAVRALPQRYSLFKYAVCAPLKVEQCEIEATVPIKYAEYICLEDVNEMGQHLYLYVGKK
jgi:hypothetical protein